MKSQPVRRTAFSVLELIVVVVILGVLAALAIPQLSSAASLSPEEQLRQQLRVLRTAIELYYQDHGAYPAQRPAGAHPAGTPGAFVRQLTMYTDAEGNVAPAPDERFRFGPYLRDEIPPCPVTGAPGNQIAIVQGPQMPGYMPDHPHAAWVYNPQTGYIAANSDQRDPQGKRYDSY